MAVFGESIWYEDATMHRRSVLSAELCGKRVARAGKTREKGGRLELMQGIQTDGHWPRARVGHMHIRLDHRDEIFLRQNGVVYFFCPWV